MCIPCPRRPKRRRAILRVLAVSLVLAPSTIAIAADLPTIDVTIKDHRFIPMEIHVQAGKATILKLKNEDRTAEEFKSPALKVEKVIVSGTYATVRLRPLGPGRYPFIGEYHPDTAKGVVISE